MIFPQLYNQTHLHCISLIFSCLKKGNYCYILYPECIDNIQHHIYLLIILLKLPMLLADLVRALLLHSMVDIDRGWDQQQELDCLIHLISHHNMQYFRQDCLLSNMIYKDYLYRILVIEYTFLQKQRITLFLDVLLLSRRHRISSFCL